MSEQSPSFSGRIIYGLQPADLGLFSRPETAFWNDETEARYMDQVRERAQQKAKEILNQALAEAEQIRQQARQDGFEHGRQEFQTLAQEEQAKAAAFLSNLDASLRAEKERVANMHKNALFSIVMLAFEKTLGTVLDAKRAEVLSALFNEAIEHLQATTSMTLYVGQADAELARELIKQAKGLRTDLPEIVIKISPELDAGGLRLESGDGVVDNSIAARFEQVQAILHDYADIP